MPPIFLGHAHADDGEAGARILNGLFFLDLVVVDEGTKRERELGGALGERDDLHLARIEFERCVAAMSLSYHPLP